MVLTTETLVSDLPEKEKAGAAAAAATATAAPATWTSRSCSRITAPGFGPGAVRDPGAGSDCPAQVAIDRAWTSGGCRDATPVGRRQWTGHGACHVTLHDRRRGGSTRTTSAPPMRPTPHLTGGSPFMFRRLLVPRGRRDRCARCLQQPARRRSRAHGSQGDPDQERRVAQGREVVPPQGRRQRRQSSST